MFGQWSCGCKGLKLEDGTCICMEACDFEEYTPNLHFYIRHALEEKEFHQSTDIKEVLIPKIEKYLAFGIQLEIVKSILK